MKRYEIFVKDNKPQAYLITDAREFEPFEKRTCVKGAEHAKDL